MGRKRSESPSKAALRMRLKREKDQEYLNSNRKKARDRYRKKKGIPTDLRVRKYDAKGSQSQENHAKEDRPEDQNTAKATEINNEED